MRTMGPAKALSGPATAIGWWACSGTRSGCLAMLSLSACSPTLWLPCAALGAARWHTGPSPFSQARAARLGGQPKMDVPLIGDGDGAVRFRASLFDFRTCDL